MAELPITSLKGVGDELAKKFAILGVKTVEDLINFLPRRYEDYSQLTPLNEIRPGLVTVQANIEGITARYARRGMHITEAVARADGEAVRLIWFNQPYRGASIKPGQPYFISGQFELSRQRFAIMNPSIELASDFPVNTARIIPIYRQTKGFTSKQIRKAVYEALKSIRQMTETLPDWLIQERKLAPLSEALEAMHFPQNAEKLQQAKHRLGFEEVFRLTLASLLNKYELLRDTSLAIDFDQELAKRFVSSLPFTLTDAQRKVSWRIYQDMQRTQPMNRLVEGDVGSGKTVVATMAAVMAMKAGYQVALMAPTELLARQHADTIYDLLSPLNMENQAALLAGGLKSADKVAAQKAIKDGHAQFIIGTHALIQEKVDMPKLGLVIIDEQHRFGVGQRKKLMGKAGHMPHLLSLTATPIPRSLALTLYGELDISLLDAKPAGRQPIETEICSPNSRDQLYSKIDEELQAGRQMFVVCPLISESEINKAAAAEVVHAELSKKHFKHRRVGLLHGKMKSDEKSKIMQRFASRELDILVSTTVIEVGVDVPNASIMLIEAADKFGLAQLHQLRGRVGRGGHQGFCYLMMSDSKAPPKRLRALEQSNDGFELAELDLEIRGPGAIYGTMQHGELDLRVASLSDTKLIAQARQSAEKFIERGEDLLQYKALHKHIIRLRAVTNLN